MDCTPDLRLGRWEDVLADVECDALVTDPPFGERTHAAWREGARYMCRPGDVKRGKIARPSAERELVRYAAWTPADVAAFVASWSPRVRGWMVALTSHDLAPAWQDAYETAGRYAFAPLPCVTSGGSIRLAGDGPSNWTVWAMVARRRTRHMHKWGTLPGAYVATVSKAERAEQGGGRGKPLDLMRAIVRDYSRPGDLIVDPCAGYGTTGVAALSMGRRFIGAEMDPAAHAEGLARLARVQPFDLFDTGKASQPALIGVEKKSPRRDGARSVR